MSKLTDLIKDCKLSDRPHNIQIVTTKSWGIYCNVIRDHNKTKLCPYQGLYTEIKWDDGHKNYYYKCTKK